MTAEKDASRGRIGLPGRPRWPYQAVSPVGRKAFAVGKDRHEPGDERATTEERRRARLAASLRENLKRRKAQSRAREAEAAPGERTRDDPGR